MTTKYWIKLYHEILDDPKMGLLPDNVYRRCIELFLLAGRIDQDGALPDTKELAWMLRQNPETLEAELQHLAAVYIITKTPTGWLVTHFSKRQEAVPDSDRMKQYRRRLREKQPADTRADTPPLQEDCNSVTNGVTKRNIDTDTDTDINNIGENEKDGHQEDIGKAGANAPTITAIDLSEKPRTALMEYFVTYSGLPKPTRKKEMNFWWSGITEIYNIGDKNLDKSKRLIKKCVDKLREDKVTIGGPESLIKTIRDLYANGSGIARNWRDFG